MRPATETEIAAEYLIASPLAPLRTPSYLRHVGDKYKRYEDPRTTEKKMPAAKRMKKTGSGYRGKPSQTKRKTTSKGGWKAKARSQIGERVGSSTSKTRIQGHNTAPIVLDTRTLLVKHITGCAYGVQRNEREENRINVRGIRTEIAVANELNVPLFVHYAWVSPKQGYVPAQADNYPATTQFFRSYDTNRAEDFGVDLSSLEFRNNGINTDKFVVLKHHKFQLGGAATTGTAYDDGNMLSFRHHNFYIPIGRQLRFDSHAIGAPTDGPVYFLMWCDEFHKQGGALANPDAMRYYMRHIMYFKEPKES